MKKQNITSFEEAVNYINATPRFTTKNTMEDTKAFLHRLGDPDRGMRIIHVAGTNGKGSVCAYLQGILMAAGYTTAMFISPHLVETRERFHLDRELVSEEEFAAGYEKIHQLVEAWRAEQDPEYYPA